MVSFPRRICAACLAVSALFGSPGAAQPLARAELRASAELSCPAAASPGRVRCDLTVTAAEGSALSWVDALVTARPPFASPLRARVPAERSSGRAVRVRSLPLAFVAERPGTGEVAVLARAVVCRGAGRAEACRALQLETRAELRVGP